jgi:hypothetical protein
MPAGDAHCGRTIALAVSGVVPAGPRGSGGDAMVVILASQFVPLRYAARRVDEQLERGAAWRQYLSARHAAAARSGRADLLVRQPCPAAGERRCAAPCRPAAGQARPRRSTSFQGVVSPRGDCEVMLDDPEIPGRRARTEDSRLERR